MATTAAVVAGHLVSGVNQVRGSSAPPVCVPGPIAAGAMGVAAVGATVAAPGVAGAMATAAAVGFGTAVATGFGAAVGKKLVGGGAEAKAKTEAEAEAKAKAAAEAVEAVQDAAFAGAEAGARAGAKAAIADVVADMKRTRVRAKSSPPTTTTTTTSTVLVATARPLSQTAMTVAYALRTFMAEPNPANMRNAVGVMSETNNRHSFYREIWRNISLGLHPGQRLYETILRKTPAQMHASLLGFEV